jgi:protein phosphatase
MRAIAAGLTDIGRERNHNEDRYILLPEFNVYVVADGMGGHQSGEVASRMAASTIASYFRTANGAAPVDVPDRLKAAVCDANAKIFARADDSRAHRGMGTTVVAAAYSPNGHSMHVVHAGDSRAYHLRGDKLKQLTRDHSLLSDALLERPELTESDLAYLPRNVITRALGIAPTVDVDVTSCDVEPGDVFLLCSDGLHGLVDDEHMKAIIRATDVLTEACSRLVEAANRNGGKDNITAVLVRIEEEDEPWSQRSPGALASSPARVSSSPSAKPASVRPSNGAGSAAADETPSPPAVASVTAEAATGAISEADATSVPEAAPSGPGEPEIPSPTPSSEGTAEGGAKPKKKKAPKKKPV